MAITTGTSVSIIRSTFTGNAASSIGGAVQVSGCAALATNLNPEISEFAALDDALYPPNPWVRCSSDSCTRCSAVRSRQALAVSWMNGSSKSQRL